MRKLRIVVDTNVIVSTFYGGNPDQVLKYIEDNQAILLISKEILKELNRVLTAVLKDDIYITRLINFIKLKGVMINPQQKLNIIKKDPSDNKFLECAVSGRADYIVSGDKKHLLSLKKFQNIPILNPREFLEKIQD